MKTAVYAAIVLAASIDHARPRLLLNGTTDYASATTVDLAREANRTAVFASRPLVVFKAPRTGSSFLAASLTAKRWYCQERNPLHQERKPQVHAEVTKAAHKAYGPFTNVSSVACDRAVSDALAALRCDVPGQHGAFTLNIHTWDFYKAISRGHDCYARFVDVLQSTLRTMPLVVSLVRENEVQQVVSGLRSEAVAEAGICDSPWHLSLCPGAADFQITVDPTVLVNKIHRMKRKAADYVACARNLAARWNETAVEISYEQVVNGSGIPPRLVDAIWSNTDPGSLGAADSRWDVLPPAAGSPILANVVENFEEVREWLALHEPSLLRDFLAPQ
jgi:LPS sulfotransferase NodH